MKISMQYPDSKKVNKNFDGQIHSITPMKLLYKKGVYFLHYIDESLDKEMYTYMIERNGDFYNVPLNSYKDAMVITDTFPSNAELLDTRILPPNIKCTSISDIDDLKKLFHAKEVDTKLKEQIVLFNPELGYYIPLEIANEEKYNIDNREHIIHDYKKFKEWVSISNDELIELHKKFKITVIFYPIFKYEIKKETKHDSKKLKETNKSYISIFFIDNKTCISLSDLLKLDLRLYNRSYIKLEYGIPGRYYVINEDEYEKIVNSNYNVGKITIDYEFDAKIEELNDSK